MKRIAPTVLLALLALSYSSAPALAASSKAKLITDTATSANTVPFINAGAAEDGTAATALGVQINGTERLRVTATGYVGIGTTSPDDKMAINGNSYIINGSLGFNRVPSTGALPTGGCSTCGRYQITPNSSYLSIASRTSSDGLGGEISVTTTGYVGIGTTAPNTMLHVAGEATFTALAAGQGVSIRARTSDEYTWGPLVYNNAGTAYIGGMAYSPTAVGLHLGSSLPAMMLWYSNGNAILAGSLSQGSDLRLKKDLHSIERALEKLTQLRGVTFHWKDEKKDPAEQIGVIAQEVQKDFPQLVNENKDGLLSVNYSGLVAPLIEAVKELKAENDALRARVEKLERQTH